MFDIKKNSLADENKKPNPQEMLLKNAKRLKI